MEFCTLAKRMQQYTVKNKTKDEVINTFSKAVTFSALKAADWTGFIPASANVSECSQNKLIRVHRSC